MTLLLHGYRYSVYNRIARLALTEKAIDYQTVEVNPFDPGRPSAYLALHPFNRVPTLVHDGFVLYETGAITRYIARGFPGAALQPEDPRAAARMDQILGVVDSYAYWPLVRQVFAHDVFRRWLGSENDPGEIANGLAAAATVLRALEALVADDSFLVGPAVSLADFHLGAMIAYFVLSPRGAGLLDDYPRLATWWQRFSTRPSIVATDPGVPVTQA